jgi:hypothetical protein
MTLVADYLASGISTMVEQSTQDPQFEGLNSAATGTGRQFQKR